jgi:hypothetical protein
MIRETNSHIVFARNITNIKAQSEFKVVYQFLESFNEKTFVTIVMCSGDVYFGENIFVRQHLCDKVFDLVCHRLGLVTVDDYVNFLHMKESCHLLWSR